MKKIGSWNHPFLGQIDRYEPELSDFDFSQAWEDLDEDDQANFLSFIHQDFLNSSNKPFIKARWEEIGEIVARKQNGQLPSAKELFILQDIQGGIEKIKDLWPGNNDVSMIVGQWKSFLKTSPGIHYNVEFNKLLNSTISIVEELNKKYDSNLGLEI